MTANRVRCMFCFAERGDNISPSREHVISRPVAQHFGLDREDSLVRMDLDEGKFTQRTISGYAYKCVCRTCNSTWMNRLEHDMEGVASWLSGATTQPLGRQRSHTLRAWAIKTHLMLCYLEGEAGAFMDADNRRAVIAPFTLARALYEGNTEVVDAAAVAIARASTVDQFGFAFGHPTMAHVGPGKWNARFAPASVVTVGSLQVWVCTPFLPDEADVQAPHGLMAVAPGVRPVDLAVFDQPRDVRGVVVDYGADHDADAVVEHLMRLASQE